MTITLGTYVKTYFAEIIGDEIGSDVFFNILVAKRTGTAE
jgi:hypothetical protein